MLLTPKEQGCGLSKGMVLEAGVRRAAQELLTKNIGLK